MMQKLKKYIAALITVEGRVLFTMFLLFNGLAGSIFKQAAAVDYAGASILGILAVWSFVIPLILLGIIISRGCKNIIEREEPTF
ncbi:hypothetical protein OZL92_17635 [Bacillus sonorensis]|uniref:Uncharacterized protein n=2 Tax=Bacillus sonorensis TaxID=119858 RepID=M5PA44_9BACI|nr:MULTISPECIES: hypothetical protein [Bacillus]ASB89203.1 hypothetical protein S101395_02696 [Bacillus sonorensis]EME72160.1 hypothetical protein BSONL12_22710 [Bacillus sonorensis L12]MBG9915136.1 hypothetical protein [Bacillus sonorensis]MCY7858726.1 hypothetical protein [Bacillus sonorensis]MCY8026819.1 hypothetical protein [Bacillus sonorensis]